MPLLKINIVFFIFLALATIVSHSVVEEYEPDGPELLNNNWNTRVFANGRADVNEKQLTLFPVTQEQAWGHIMMFHWLKKASF